MPKEKVTMSSDTFYILLVILLYLFWAKRANRGAKTLQRKLKQQAGPEISSLSSHQSQKPKGPTLSMSVFRRLLSTFLRDGVVSQAWSLGPELLRPLSFSEAARMEVCGSQKRIPQDVHGFDNEWGPPSKKSSLK